MRGTDLSPTDEPAPSYIDTTKASIARVYDCFLGGKDNYEVDREVYRQILKISPEASTVAKEHRNWLVRTVRFLAGAAGVDQFLDCGSGLPTAENTHQVVQRINPAARVVYIDNDPIVLAHGRALLEENDGTRMIDADLTRPGEVLGHPAVTKHLDLSRPIALIQCATIHHVDDELHPEQIMADYIDRLAAGSYVALAHWYDPADGSERSAKARAMEQQFRGSSMETTRFRTRAEIASYFGGLELIEPGLVHPHEWWPDGPRLTPLRDLNFAVLGGVGRKP